MCKKKIDLLLAYREVDHVVTLRNPHDQGPIDYYKWVKCDKMARAVIGLSISDNMLGYVRGLEPEKEMLDSIVNLLQRHILLNKLRARREVYTATMKPKKKMLTYINSIRHLSTIQKPRDVTIDDKEVATAVLNRLTSKYGNTITALDAVEYDSKFSLEFVKSHLLQEEPDNSLRSDGVKTKTVLVHNPPQKLRNSFKCNLCGGKRPY